MRQRLQFPHPWAAPAAPPASAASRSEPAPHGSGSGAAWAVARAHERRPSVARAASRCMNSSGLITRCVVPSRHGVLSLSSTWPAALSCTLSSASAGRVMVRHSCSSRLRSCASTRTAARHGPDRRAGGGWHSGGLTGQGAKSVMSRRLRRTHWPAPYRSDPRDPGRPLWSSVSLGRLG